MEKEELIQRIKQKLSTHVSPYEEGSWERFAQKHIQPTGKQVKRFPYWIAAACLTFIAGITYWMMPANPHVYVSTPINGYQFSTEYIHNIYTTKTNVLDSNGNLVNNINIQRYSTIATSNRELDSVSGRSAAGTPTAIKTIAQNSSVDTIKINEIKPYVSNDPVEMPLEKKNIAHNNPREKAPLLSAKEDRGKRWNIGAQMSTSMGQSNKANLSYGIHIGFAINDKITIRSGAAYARINTAINFSTNIANNAPIPITASSSEEQIFYVQKNTLTAKMIPEEKATISKQKLYSELSLSGIEIPLDICYHFNKKFYSNIGISTIALTSKKQYNYYMMENNKDRGFQISENNVTSNIDISMITSETSDGNSMLSSRALTFLNASIGYKQALSSKSNIRVEPFVKISVANNNDAAIPFNHMGLRLAVEL